MRFQTKTLGVLVFIFATSTGCDSSSMPGFLNPILTPLFSWKPTRQLLSFLNSGSVPQSYFSEQGAKSVIESNRLKTYEGTLQLPIDLENYAFQFARRSPAPASSAAPVTPAPEVTLVLTFEENVLRIPFHCPSAPGMTDAKPGRDFTLFRAKKVHFQWIPNPLAAHNETCEILSFGFVPLAPHYASTGEARANKAPEGEIEKMDEQGLIAGWAVDRDTPDQPLFIHFFIDGEVKSPKGQYFGELQTHLSRPELNARFKTLSPHGFQFQIPEKYRDGKRHEIWVYALDSESGAHQAITKNALIFDKPSVRKPKF